MLQIFGQILRLSHNDYHWESFINTRKYLLVSELVRILTKSEEGNKKTQTGGGEEKQFSQTPFTNKHTHK